MSIASEVSRIDVLHAAVHELSLNRRAYARLRCEKKLAIVPGATHLFEEPGTLETAAGLARDWLERFLAPVSEQRRKFQ